MALAARRCGGLARLAHPPPRGRPESAPAAVLGSRSALAAPPGPRLAGPTGPTNLGPALSPMTFQSEILSRRQHQVLTRLSALLTPRGYYLGGGTAVALHLGHRRSGDLDWFTAECIGDPLRLGQEL